MRDKQETAETTNAGLVGNKVIVTYHTNSVVDTVLRMLEEDVSRNKIANGVKVVYAQRLIKKLCPHCSLPDHDTETIERKIKQSFFVAQKSLQYSLSDILKLIPEDRFSLDGLEIELERRLKFLSSDDVDSIIQSLLSEEKKFNKLSSREEKEKMILDAALPYPNNEIRQYFEETFKNKNFRIRNPEGCSHPDCR